MDVQSLPQISSKENSIIKDTRALRQKKERDEQNRFFVEGLRLCEEAAAADFRCCHALISEAFANGERAEGLLRSLLAAAVPVYLVPDNIIEYCADTQTPQGIIMVMEKKPASALSELAAKEFIMMLDAVRDPGNLGTVLRTARAAGADAVVLLTETVDQYNPKTLRASMGASFASCLMIIEAEDDEAVFRILAANNIKIYAAAAGGENIYGDIDLKSPLAWVLGSEADGVKEYWRAKADKIVSLPMPGGGESLNISAAAAVIAYETVRRKKF